MGNKVYDVVVIGCGPTGIASLFHSKLNGMSAIGLESGDRPLYSISQYPDGLIFVSPAQHFEIGGIPLDCKQWNQVTKEEILSYYSRIINLQKIQLRCNHKFIGLSHKKHFVEVLCATPEGHRKFLSRKVIFTAWFQARQLDLINPPDSGIEILHHISNPIQVAGKDVIVLGGGMSGVEIAMLLMMSGQPITFLLRGKKGPIHFGKTFVSLVASTNSTVIESTTAVKIKRQKVIVICPFGKKAIRCNVIIACIGRSFNTKSLQILRRFGVIERDQVQRILESSQMVPRSHYQVNEAEIKRAYDSWPNLYEEFVNGRKNVHLVGAALHIGSFSAGTRISIYTAKTCADIIAKKHLKASVGRNLPLHLFNIVRTLEISLSSAVFSLRPIRVRSWSRALYGLYDNSPSSTRSDFYLGKSKDRDIARLLELSDGQRTVEEIIVRSSKRPEDSKRVLGLLFELFYNNGLTWLVPQSKQ